MSRQTRHPLLLRTKNMATAYQNLSEYDFNSVPDGSEVTVGIVVAEWNKHITEKLLEGACNTLEKHGVKAENIFVKRVPGSFELTFGAKKMAETKEVDAVIVLGCVVRGDTPHFDYVCSAGHYRIKSYVRYSVHFRLVNDRHYATVRRPCRWQVRKQRR